MFKWLFKIENNLQESGTTIPEVTVEPVIELPKFDISNFHDEILEKVVRKRIITKLIEDIDPEYYSRKTKSFSILNSYVEEQPVDTSIIKEEEEYNKALKPLLGVTVTRSEGNTHIGSTLIQYYNKAENTVLADYFYSLFHKEVDNLVESLQTKK